MGLLANTTDLKGLKRLIEIYEPHTAVCVGQKYLYSCGKEYPLPADYLNRPESYAETDLVINGIAGIAGLSPTLAVLRAKKVLATANKESFVCAGALINSEKKLYNGIIYPLDSEHSAAWQLIDGKKGAEKIYLTASGGAFRDLTKRQLERAKASDALRHPNWVMGKKVTIDCATLMNKGMELIEAKHLFDVPAEAIGHRESIVHALVKYSDGSYHANLSAPDMVSPIAYALRYPDVSAKFAVPLDLTAEKQLTFFSLDEERFPCLRLAKSALAAGDAAGCVIGAADEILVERYLRGEIAFYDIAEGIDRALQKFHPAGNFDSLDSVFRMDKAVREYTLSIDFGGRI